MILRTGNLILISFLLSCSTVPSLDDLKSADSYVWLEKRKSDRSIKWVEEQNSKTKKILGGNSNFSKIKNEISDIVNNKSMLPEIEIIGESIYSIYYPSSNSRGVWKRTPLSNPDPNIVNWETVFNIDSFNKKRGKKYTLKGVRCLKPVEKICLLSLSTSGGDKSEIFEFDLESKSFVKNGFFFKDNKTNISWVDRDTLVVSTDFGRGTLLKSGFGRELRLYRRGLGVDNKAIITTPEDYLGIFVKSFQTANGQPGLGEINNLFQG